MAWLVVAFLQYGLAHYVYPAIWSFYAKAAFAWSSAGLLWVGFASAGWKGLAVIPVTALGVIVTPLFATQLLGHFADATAPMQLPGAPFLAAALVMTLALVPFAAGLKRLRTI